MITEIQATGKTVNDAVEALKVKLCVDTLDEVDWKLVSAGKKGGLFGIGAQPAKVVAFVETPDPVEEKKPEPKKEAPKAEKKPADKKPEKKADKKPTDKKPAEKKAEPKKSEPKPKKPKTPTTEAEVKAAMSFVETLVKNLELNVTAAVTEDAENENASMIIIGGEDAGMLIGHHGETLDAVQYLANLAANRAEGKDDHERITVDVEGYREKREETLRALARRMAAKVQKYGRSVVMEPMNPYERRIIHSEIQEIEGVSTNSIGSDSNRKVVIFLTEKGMGKLPPKNSDGRRGDRNRRRRGGRGHGKPQGETAAAEAVESAPAEATDAE